jgi:hypothetical protein
MLVDRCCTVVDIFNMINDIFYWLLGLLVIAGISRYMLRRWLEN